MPRPSRAVPLTALTLLAVLLSGCTSDPDPEAGPPSAPSSASPSSSAPEPLRLETAVARVAGKLSQARRERVARKAGAVVEDYLQAAFLAGPPQGAFDSFTSGARKQARHDRRLLTAAGLRSAEPVTATHAAAYLSVLAPRGRVVGATARLEADLRVERRGEPRTVRLRGRLMLTPTAKGWRIFGYDLSRSVGARKRSK